MSKLKGYLSITSLNNDVYSNLEEVDGTLHIYANSKIRLKKLKIIKGNLFSIVNNSIVSCSNLKIIQCNLFLRNSLLNANNLVSITGLLELKKGAILNAPLLVDICQVDFDSDVILLTPKLFKKFNEKYFTYKLI